MSATETKPEQPYVDFHHDGYWVAGTRISLDSIVYRWREGLSPEAIQRECFSVLSLRHVYGAITYYLEHQTEIDAYLLQAEQEEEVVRQQLREAYPKGAQAVDRLAAQFAQAHNEDQVPS